jgi:hypothetical protein
MSLLGNQTVGLAVDIDETLSGTNLYWIAELQKKFGNPEGLSIQQMAEKYNYTQNIPYYQTEEALQWMDEQIGSNDMQELLPLIENANTAVQEINRMIPIVAYITVRPESVTQGTQKWLQKHNFPSAPVIARPSNVFHLHGSKWKAGVLERLYPNVKGIIDDNPSLVAHLSARYQGTVYLYNASACSHDHIKVIPCKSWDDVLMQIKTDA